MEPISKDVEQFHALESHRKVAVAGIIIVVFLVSLGVGIAISRGNRFTQFVPGQPSTQKQQKTNPQGSTALAIKTSSQKVQVGDTFTASVMISDTPVQVADVIITYDPKLVKVTQVQNGTVFDNLLQNSIEDGSVTVSGAVDPSEPQSLKDGEVFSLTLTALAPGQAALSFDSDRTITAKDGSNTLSNATGTTVSIQ